MNTRFRQLLNAEQGALCYLLADVVGGRAAVIDPAAGDPPMLDGLLAERGLRLDAVLFTHLHGPADPRIVAWCRRAGARMVAGAPALAAADAQRVDDGAHVVFGDEVVHVIATPGHTPDSVSYLWHDRLMCGDALAAGGCPACDGSSDPGALYDSVVRRLFALPGDTLVFPGHDLSGRTVSTVAEERRRNPAFGGRTRDGFLTDLSAGRFAPATPIPAPAGASAPRRGQPLSGALS